MTQITLTQEETSKVQKAHALVDALNEIYLININNDSVKETILADLSDAKAKFEQLKNEIILSKVPENHAWELDYLTCTLEIK